MTIFPTYRFILFSQDLPVALRKVEIPPLKDFNEGAGDVYERDEEFGYFFVDKPGKLTMYAEAYDHLRYVRDVYGIKPEVRLIVEKKDDLSLSEDWKLITNIGLDLGTLDFDDDARIVAVDTNVGGIIDQVESRAGDEFDLMKLEGPSGEELSALPYVSVSLEPREIFRKSRVRVEVGTQVSHPVGGGDNLSARSIPFKVFYNSDPENIVNTYSDQLSAAGGFYADLSDDKFGALWYLSADRLRRIRISGTITVRQSGTPHPGSFRMDLLRYTDGDEFNFGEVILPLGIGNPAITGSTTTYTFNEYEVLLQPGDSLAIGTLADVFDGIRYTVDEADLIIKEDDLYPPTTTKALKIRDAFDRLLAMMTGQEGLVESTVFGPGGKYENVLLVNGRWLRNVPDIVNEGEEDEQRVQAPLSFDKLYEAISIIEPMTYRAKNVGLGQHLEIRAEKETQKNKVGIRIGEIRGTFQLTQVSDPERKVLGDQIYGKIEIGSTTSGSEYGEVNNLYSVCGVGRWLTINRKSKDPYSRTTEFRTGSEDIELQRQKQHEDRPDRDGEYDDDWFFIDCKFEGGQYVVKRWDDYYETEPEGSYSPGTNYNWLFTPTRLFLNHGWKLKSGFYQGQYINDSVSFSSSNCNPSLTTKKAGEDPLGEGQNIPHSRIEAPTFTPMLIEFKHPINQEIIDQLQDPDNLDGLVQFLSRDGVEFGRLVKVNTNGDGGWELVEANLIN